MPSSSLFPLLQPSAAHPHSELHSSRPPPTLLVLLLLLMLLLVWCMIVLLGACFDGVLEVVLYDCVIGCFDGRVFLDLCNCD